jgi:DNA-binding NtrC family response regulator
VYGDLDALLVGVAAERPDVVLTDIRMPPTCTDEGIPAADRSAHSDPGLAVVVLSRHLDPTYAVRLSARAAPGVGTCSRSASATSRSWSTRCAGSRLLVRPETVLRRHRDLLARRQAAISRPKRTGRQPTVRSIRALVLRLARENSSWGYRRIHGELLTLGIKVAASTVWEILEDAGFDPAPERTTDSWASLLRSQAAAGNCSTAC